MSIKEAKVGDKIKCMREFSRTDFDVYAVERLTKTLAICNPPATFRLNNGLKVGSGSSYRRRYGSLATQADFDELDLRIRLNAARDALREFGITPENIEAVESLLKANKP